MDKELRYTIFSGVAFVFGTFCLALCYNLFFVPNNLVVGGTSGLAIVLEKISGINVQIFIYSLSFLLIVLCYLLLGITETKKVLIGSILYPLFITFTYPIAIHLIKILDYHEILVTYILAALLNGVSNGIIYKYGFSTGGSDVIMKIMGKYLHLSEGKSLLIFNSLIIASGAFLFGIEKATYAIIILVISSIIVDKISIGISNSKKFMIYTKKSSKITKLIQGDFLAGYTIFPTVGGYSHTKGSMIMCVIRNRDVNYFKVRILELDPEAFFVISDCYEVQGGIKRSNLPFL